MTTRPAKDGTGIRDQKIRYQEPDSEPRILTQADRANWYQAAI